MRIEPPGEHPGQIVGERTDVLGNRHLVVVQNHQQVIGQRAGVAQGLEGHPGGHCPIADDGDGTALAPLTGGGDRHAQGRAHRGTGMTHGKGVVFALSGGREGRQSAALLDGVQPVAASL